MKAYALFAIWIGLLAGNSWGLESSLSVLIDADNDVLTGCQVATPSGDMSGVDGRIDVLIESNDAGFGEISSAVFRACNSSTDEFGAPSALPDNLGPIAVGLDGFNAVEVGLASPFGEFAEGGEMRIGVLASNENGAEDALLSTAPGDQSPILFAINAAFAPIPIPIGGVFLVLSLALLILMSAAVIMKYRKTSALAMVGLAGLVLAQGASLRFDWSELPLAETNATDPASGVDIRAVFAQARRDGSLDLAFRVDMALEAEPVSLDAQGSPLTLTANGPTDSLTITNLSANTTALNIVSDFSGTALDGNVTETGNTCAAVAAGDSCTITFTPGNTVVPQTNFPIQGTNTAVLTAAIAIQSGSTLTTMNPTSGPASGGTGFTLTGTGLTGATAVRFDGVPATSVNVVNSTTVTGVTPAHAAGAVDVEIDTPAGGALLTNGYTYEAIAVGQAAFGGTVACLNGGLNNLIAATADNSTSIQWGGFGTAVGVGAQSDTDGAGNTAAIVSCLTGPGGGAGCPENIAPGTYAAGICSSFEVDSQGNTPCQAGNTCYDDWFLPAGDNLTPSGQLNCLVTNRVAIGGFANEFYWSSTEFSGNPTVGAWVQDIFSGAQSADSKSVNRRVRCVRAFVP